VERELKSDALCTVLTEPVFSDRLLGASKTVSAPSSSTFFVTGNNVEIVGDLTARTVSCALDAEVERPEEREFDVNLHKLVPENRAELAVAALTIVRAYIAAGEPKPRSPTSPGSRTGRGSCAGRWSGSAWRTPARAASASRAAIPVRVQLGGLLDAWRENYPGEAATVAEAVKLATRDPVKDEPKRTPKRGGG
jgi:putative DNA primase/helicase